MEVVLAILTAITIILPAIIATWKRKEAKDDKAQVKADDLTRHSIDELHIATSVMRKQGPTSPTL